ncbi:hypothetical protein [Calidifontibacter indicus]
MDHTLVPLFARLEKAAVSGPGKHELARIFFALPEPLFHRDYRKFGVSGP